jgi:hypothetical protein
MRNAGKWGIAAALIIGFGVAALADDSLDKDTKDTKDTKSSKSKKGPPQWRTTPVWAKASNWYGPVGEESKPDPKKPADKKANGKPAKEPAAPAVAAKPAGAGDAVVRSPEEAEFLRRSEACLKLREIALRNNDPELLRRAEQLDEKAWAAYSQRLATKPGDDKFDSDEQALDHLLSPGKDDKSKSSSKIHSVPGQDNSRQASLREGK